MQTLSSSNEALSAVRKLFLKKQVLRSDYIKQFLALQCCAVSRYCAIKKAHETDDGTVIFTALEKLTDML